MKCMILIFAIVELSTGHFKSKYPFPNSKRISENTKTKQKILDTQETFKANISPYIIGGNEVDPPHKYPFLVVLRINYQYYCNGALISDQWVLTAAHCMDGAFGVDIYLGEQDLSSDDGTEQSGTSSEYYLHDDYYAPTKVNDIALVKIYYPVNFTDAVQPINLPSVDDKDLGGQTNVTIIGFGGWHQTTNKEFNKNKRKMEGTLIPNSRITNISQNQFSKVQRSETTNIAYEVNVQTITNSECASFYGSEAIQTTNLCTSSEKGGASDIDSGSPVVYETENGVQLRGIVSYGSSTVRALEPDIHSRVTHYLNWIQDTTGILY